MHLLRCNPPSGLLEPAPRTSLHSDSADEAWEGFWCVADEGYYTRCTRSDGAQEWFRFAPEADVVTEVRGARVLPLRRRGQSMVMARQVLVGSWQGNGTRTVLVGASRRRATGDDRGGRP